MTTGKLLACAFGLVAVSTSGLASQRAAAAEEIVVDGTEAAVLAAAEREYFRSEISEYVQSLGDQIKVTLSTNPEKLLAPKFYLAESETRIRG